MLEVRNLRCGYGSLEVIHGISFHVSKGETVALIGSNGAGKTSLLKSVAGLLPPWSGSIRLNQHEMKGKPAWETIRHGMSLVPEGRQVFADLTVEENLITGGYRNPERNTDLDLVLAQFPRLHERLRQHAGTLSGGEQQMLALGRSLMGRPQVLLMDEPSMGLAPLMVREVFEAIRRMRETGITILLVEQNAVAALEVANRGYVLETGEIIFEGLANDLAHNPAVRQAYLGGNLEEGWE